MPIGVALLLRGFLPMLALGTLTNVGQVLQTDDTVWVLGNNAMTDLVVSILFQPSLPSTNHHKAAGSGTGAFLLQPLSQSRIVIGFGTYCLARIEGCGIFRSCRYSQITLSNIHTNDTAMCLRCWRLYFKLKRDEQIELLLGF